MKVRHPYQGPNLRHYRELQGLSLRELAERTGIAYTTIGNYERGTTEISYDAALKLSESLGIPVQMIWDHIDASRAQRRPEPQETATHR